MISHHNGYAKTSYLGQSENPRYNYQVAPDTAVTWADWPGFVPAAVEGAALVQYVLPMRLRGKPHHVEAGAWWNGSGTGVRSLTR